MNNSSQGKRHARIETFFVLHRSVIECMLRLKPHIDDDVTTRVVTRALLEHMHTAFDAYMRIVED